ncbi:phosphonoacetaldehyde hydrolase [Staphylococcus caeli]|uniref:phosphonoacetaldehyde hydrolase n=1 Tax=Staphylococcus caeli TaxID=2201815 RepID=UPI003F57942E
MTKIKAIIMDWAGTTIDFGCFAPVNVFVDIFNEAGVSVTIDEARAPMGMLKRDHIKVMTEMPRINQAWKDVYGVVPNEKDIDTLYANFEKALMENLKSFTDPIPHVVDVVANLQQHGYVIGSTTGYTQEMMEIVIPEAKSKGYSPDNIVTADQVGGYGRPYPYMIFENMKELEIDSVKSVIKVGDTVSDIKEAVNAGVIAVGVIKGSSVVGLNEQQWSDLSEGDRQTYIEQATNTFKQHQADYILEDITQLPQLLDRLNKN